MKKIFLEDLKGFTEEQIKEHIVEDYSGELSEGRYFAEEGNEVEKKELRKKLKDFYVLIAYESVGSYGCDSSSFFLLKEKKTGKLFENHASHCSCYGFEGQWKPEETTIQYLKSDKFYFYSGGYDGDEEGNSQKVLDYIKNLSD